MLNDLSKLLGIELLIDHHCDQLAYELVDEDFSCLGYAEMVPDGFVSQFLCEDGHN